MQVEGHFFCKSSDFYMEAINETTARSQSFAYVRNVRNQTYLLRVESLIKVRRESDTIHNVQNIQFYG